MGEPVRIHPANPRIFEFRGRPRMLLCATEHYGAVMNRPFRFERYLADAAEGRQTLTRLFVLFRELQSAQNPYSTCKPESPDYVAPFRRVGPDKALDGQPRYDLAQWNPEFFNRLHRFVSLASDLGIVVEVTLLSNTYGPDVWALNPLNARNNINGTEEIAWPEYMSMRHPRLWARQQAHVRRIVEELNRYDNVILEICNEPGGHAPGGAANPGCDEVNSWQREIAALIRSVEAPLANRHLVCGQEAFDYQPFRQLSDGSFHEMPFDVVNVHPLPGTIYRNVSYDMGAFMSKELRLRQFRDYCLATLGERRPLNLDEDNVASQYKDPEGWTIHRKRAWIAMLCQRHYDCIDFSIIPWRETGTPDSRRHIRRWMKHLSELVHVMDLARSRPRPGWLLGQPPHTLEAVLGIEAENYLVYLADEREIGEPGAGSPVRGTLDLELPPGTYRVWTSSPVTGLSSPWVTVEGGRRLSVGLPEFSDDLVVRLEREGAARTVP